MGIIYYWGHSLNLVINDFTMFLSHHCLHGLAHVGYRILNFC